MEQREFVVEQETAGQRIDRFLSGEDTGLSRSALQALVADGHVLCNGRQVAKSLKLKAGDTILLEIPDAKPIEAVPQDIQMCIRDRCGRVQRKAGRKAAGSGRQAAALCSGDQLSGADGKRPEGDRCRSEH